MKKKLKRIISAGLAAALVITAIPLTSMAKTSGNIYGDANGDGEIDLKDALSIKYHIAEKEPSGFKFVNADVNVDSAVDLKDLLMLKKYLAEWDIHLGPELLTVN